METACSLCTLASSTLRTKMQVSLTFLGHNWICDLSHPVASWAGQDAAPVLGDRISVHGCGVVGALTSRLLARMGHEVRVVDPLPRRLKVGRRSVVGRRQAMGKPSFAGEADVSIEVSGTPQGLAEALEGTRPGGKVLMGSLYPEEVQLPLGLRFHRAEILLQSSQVSRVAGRLQPRWSKSRRARLTWEMLREIKPKAGQMSEELCLELSIA